MKCIVIFGPSAVGKTTVGRELASRIGFRLFHNHMVIELVHNFFTWTDNEFWRLVGDIRARIFQEIRDSKIAGVVFTYVWALDQDEDHDELMRYIAALGVTLESVFFVELAAEQKERLVRNRHPLRLAEKRTKQNTQESEKFLLDSEMKYKLNSNGDFRYPNQHIKLETTEISAADAADKVYDELAERSFI